MFLRVVLVLGDMVAMVAHPSVGYAKFGDERRSFGKRVDGMGLDKIEGLEIGENGVAFGDRDTMTTDQMVFEGQERYGILTRSADE